LFLFKIEMGGAIGPDVAQNRNFAHFRTEIEKLTKRLKGMERDTADWKEKFEASNDQVHVTKVFFKLCQTLG
jgi:hypothetical protein